MNKESALLLEQHFDTALESPNGVKKLRERILTLAMQGKLVKQDPKDQPASELLKKIQAEKERMVSREGAKARGKRKDHPPIKPEEVPYAVPKGWVWVRLGEICKQINGGFAFKSSAYVNDGVRVIRISDFDEQGFKNDRIVRYHFYDKLNEFSLEENNILMAMTGGTVGKSFLVRTLPEKMIVNQRVATIKFGFSILPTFINSLIQSDLIQSVIKNAKNSTNDNISMADITRFLVPLPPLAEQKRIVAKIDELMALCDKLEAQRNDRKEKILSVHRASISRLLEISNSSPLRDFATSRAPSSFDFLFSHFDPLYSVKENVAELKKTILTLAMQGKLVKQDPKDQPASELLKEIQAEKEKIISREGAKARKGKKELPQIKPEEVPYEVPKGWEWVNLRDITHEWGQKTPDKDFVYIDVGSIDNSTGIIVDDPQVLSSESAPSRARKIVKPGTVIYSTVRPYLLNIAIVEKNYNKEPIASTAFAIMHPYKSMDGKFLYRYLNSQIFMAFVESKQKGVAYPAISDGDLFKGIIPLPPLAEQKRIVAKIDELMALCDKLINQIDKATSKQTVLFDAVLAKV